MPLLRAFENQAIIPEIRNFVLNAARLAECNAQTDGDFDDGFLGQKEPLLPSVALQLYWLENETPADEVRSALSNKLCIRPAQCHHLIKKQVQGQDGWLPTHNDDFLLVLFMKDKKGTIKEIEMIYDPEDKVWRINISNDSDEFPAGTLFLAQANAL